MGEIPCCTGVPPSSSPHILAPTSVLDGSQPSVSDLGGTGGARGGEKGEPPPHLCKQRSTAQVGFPVCVGLKMYSVHSLFVFEDFLSYQSDGF